MGTRVAPDQVEAGGGSFQGAVRRMFDGIAPRYDRFNRLASLGMQIGAMTPDRFAQWLAEIMQ